jgi:hypothetical protein
LPKSANNHLYAPCPDYKVALANAPPPGPERQAVLSGCHERGAERLLALCFANGGIYTKLGEPSLGPAAREGSSSGFRSNRLARAPTRCRPTDQTDQQSNRPKICPPGQHVAQLDHLVPEEYVVKMRDNLLDRCPVSDPEEVSHALDISYLRRAEVDASEPLSSSASGESSKTLLPPRPFDPSHPAAALQPPPPAPQVSAIILEDLGAPPSQLFAAFDPTPVASASLAQVRETRRGLLAAACMYHRIHSVPSLLEHFHLPPLCAPFDHPL